MQNEQTDQDNIFYDIPLTDDEFDEQSTDFSEKPEESTDFPEEPPDSFETLSLASEQGNVDEVRRLLSIHRIAILAPALDNEPLRFACKNGHIEVVKLLLNIHGVVILADANDNEAFRLAVENNHIDVVTELCKISVIREQAATLDNLAFYRAASKGYVDIVTFLLSIKVVRDSLMFNSSKDLQLAILKEDVLGIIRLVQIEAHQKRLAVTEHSPSSSPPTDYYRSSGDMSEKLKQLRLGLLSPKSRSESQLPSLTARSVSPKLYLPSTPSSSPARSPASSPTPSRFAKATTSASTSFSDDSSNSSSAARRRFRLSEGDR